ncbi:MAG: DNA primase [Anaerofustis stercorihominis]|nr:DNA primase [Anaerofustis stercorihominis]
MAGSFSEDFIRKVTDNTDIVEIISEHTSLTKKGSRYFGVCPFHIEKTPSFSVSRERQLYYCFGCQKGGNVIGFVKDFYKYSFAESVEFLANKANIPVEYTQRSKQESDTYKKRKIAYEINRTAANYYYIQRKKNKAASDYFIKRGLSEETIKTFGLGYSPAGSDNLYRYLKSKGYSDDDILLTDLARKSKNNDGYYDYFRNRVMFPIIDVSENIVGFGGRTMGNDEPKYLNSAQTIAFFKGSTLFNLNKARLMVGKMPIIIVEGYMDVISLYDKGITSACASLGTSLSESHAKLLKRYTNDVVLCYDGDNAGINAALRAADILTAAGINVKVALLENNDDPDSFVQKYGKDAFLGYINDKSMYIIDFKIEINRRRTNFDDIVSRSAFVNNCLAELSKEKDAVKVEYYKQKIAKIAEVSFDSVNRQMSNVQKEIAASPQNINQRYKKENEDVSPSEDIFYNTDNIRDDTQAKLIRYILQGYEYYIKFIDYGGDEWCFSNTQYEEVFREVKKLINFNKDIDIFKECMYNNKIAQIISIVDANCEILSDEEVKNCIKTSKIRSVEEEIKRVRKEIAEHEKNGSANDIEMLFNEYSFLNKLLLEQRKTEV